MTVFFYRWKIKSGKENQFEENWSVVTKAIKEHCELDLLLSQARSLVRGAIEYSYPEEQFEVKIDLLSF